MEYPGSMMPYPTHGGDMRGPPAPRGRGAFKSRGRGNNSYRGKKHQRNSSHGDTGFCFNCGSADHWAPQCPENPRDYYPPGHTHPNPAKRQKTHRFGSGQQPQFYGGPHFGSQPPYDYSHPPMNNPDYDYPPMDRGYDRPMSHASPPQQFGGWQQARAPPPREAYPYPAYSPQDMPPPMPNRGQPYAGPPPPQGHGYFSREHGSFHGEADYHHQYAPETYHQPPQDRHRRPFSRMWKRSGHGPSNFTPSEQWNDEQGPHDPEQKSRNGHIVWKAAAQLARPMSSILEDSEETGNLPPATSLPRGMSVSKYVLDRPAEEFSSNIRETEDWPFMMSDPIFREIPTESEMIPVDELIARRSKIFETHKVPAKSPSPSVDGNEDEMGSQGDYFDEHIANDSTYDGSDGENGNRSRYDSDRGSLASPLSPLRERESSEGDQHPSPTRRSRSRSPSDESNGQVPEEKLEQPDEEKRNFHGKKNKPAPRNSGQDPGPGKQSRWRPYAKQAPKNQQHSFGRRFNPANKIHQRPRHDARSRSFNGQMMGSNPPKPPGPPTDPHDHTHPEGHDTANAKAPSAQGELGNEQNHGNDGAQEKPHDQSNYENSRHSRKHERSLTTKDEPRRQKDDTAAKMKRRQPRVAEAYSRRW